MEEGCQRAGRVRNDNFGSTLVERTERWREERTFSHPAWVLSGVFWHQSTWNDCLW
jgi:hypothetical protein